MTKFLYTYLPLTLAVILSVTGVFALQLLTAPMVFATSVGPLYPGTGANATNSGSLCSWVNTGNITLDDGSVSTCTLPGNGADSTDFIVGKNFGFSIPAGATINGIQTDIKASKDSGCLFANPYIEGVAITKDGSTVYKEKFPAAFLSTTLTYYTSGSSSDLWGGTYTSSEINASTFGIMAEMRCSGLSQSVISVDTIRVTIDYTASASTPDAHVQVSLPAGQMNILNSQVNIP